MNKASRWLVAAAVLVLLAAIVRFIDRDTTKESSDAVLANSEESGVSAISSLDQDSQRESDKLNVARAETVVETIVPIKTATPNTKPKQLFSTPDYGSDAYREAETLASEFLRTYSDRWSRNMIVKSDVGAVKEFIKQVESNPERLSGSFDVSPYSDVPCVVSSIRYRSPQFTPGRDAIPTNGYLAEGACDSSSTVARITVVKDDKAFRISLISPQWGVFVVKSLGDWEYSLAYRHDDAVQYK